MNDLTLDSLVAALLAERERLNKVFKTAGMAEDAGALPIYLNSGLTAKLAYADSIEGVGDVHINIADEDNLPRGYTSP